MNQNGGISTVKLAKLLGISRIAVYKQIRSGKIRAYKSGRSYYVSTKDLPELIGTKLSASEKPAIENAVRRTIEEYSEALKLLGKE